MSKQASIEISDIALFLYIGLREEEKKEKQKIEIKYSILFDDIPLASVSDQIEDTICYDKIVQEILKFGIDAHFHTIEYYGHMLFSHLQTLIGSNKAQLEVLKTPCIESFQRKIIFKISG